MQVFFTIFWWIYFFIFFTGYPLLYGLFFLLGRIKKLRHFIKERIYPLMPLAYAFVSTFFWVLMLCTGRIDFIAKKIASGSPSVLIILFSLSALLFWLPVFRKNTVVSLIHSLPFFLLPLLNMVWRSFADKFVADDYIANLLGLYTAAFIMYLLAIIFLLLIKFLYPNLIRRNKVPGLEKKLHQQMVTDNV